MEWDGIVKTTEEKGINLNEIIEKSQRTIKKVDEVLQSGKN